MEAQERLPLIHLQAVCPKRREAGAHKATATWGARKASMNARSRISKPAPFTRVCSAPQCCFAAFAARRSLFPESNAPAIYRGAFVSGRDVLDDGQRVHSLRH
jgi:hypothetical protein